MYYVYKISLLGRAYIGCTNYLRRRKDQHNGNARTRKSKLGRFLDDNNITLKTSDLKVIGEYENRQEALDAERLLARELASQGEDLLNDNYANDCTRKGTRRNWCSKEYVLVNYINHTATKVSNLRHYCVEKELDYQNIQRTATSGHYTESGYVAFYAEDWEAEQDKELYLSGRIVEQTKQHINDLKVERNAKVYEVRFPDGHTEIVKNLDKFAREHNLTSGTLHGTITKGKPTKGYQVIRRI